MHKAVSLKPIFVQMSERISSMRLHFYGKRARPLRTAGSFILVLAAFFLSGMGVAQAGPTDPLIQEQAGQVDTGSIEQYWNQLMKDYGGYFPESKPPGFSELLVSGTKSLDLSNLLPGLLRYLLHEVIVNVKLLSTIVILAIFSMVLENVQSAFERNAVSKIGYAICYLVMIVLAVNSFNVAIGYAKTAIEGMIQFMIAVVPVLLTLLASTGGVTSVTVLHPLIIFMVHTIGSAITYVIFPLLFFSAVLHIVSSITERYKVTRLANLLRSFGLGLLGFFVTVFLGVISVQGASGAVTDGMAMRTAKFVAGSFVPVVGRMFTDASDTVISASLLIKNAVGLSGVAVIILLCAFPAMKIMTLALIYNVSAAVLQPLGDSPITGCLQTIGKNMIYVFASLAAVGFMFFLAISIIIAAGNVSVMMR